MLSTLRIRGCEVSKNSLRDFTIMPLQKLYLSDWAKTVGHICDSFYNYQNKCGCTMCIFQVDLFLTYKPKLNLNIIN